ncbi:hypothetical protein K435DRAFT_802836 [Dendrothele bispora CBS 962.96]|uniref:Uncharacterized protein n=1 Tax=Dendrothele bispora (strain CBS 962.96) TaxID=1314807 RepID=A0A4V4HE29_DENBC|nr:hypothetical protein K435DRAFT_802836 [Dendrothele bispora CBS 962.96]
MYLLSGDDKFSEYVVGALVLKLSWVTEGVMEVVTEMVIIEVTLAILSMLEKSDTPRDRTLHWAGKKRKSETSRTTRGVKVNLDPSLLKKTHDEHHIEREAKKAKKQAERDKKAAFATTKRKQQKEAEGRIAAFEDKEVEKTDSLLNL